VEIKLEFNGSNPKNPVAHNGTNGRFPGNAYRGYVQAISRAIEAFKQGKQIYYVAVTDFQSIILWKIKDAEEHVESYHLGPFPFGGYWKDGRLTFPAKQKGTQPPKGFTGLVAVLNAVMKASAEPITIHSDKFSDSRNYVVSRILGKGRCSLVFAAKDKDQREVCIKLEPVEDSHQLFNELKILHTLENCVGVPRVIFSGTGLFRDRKWFALVTDVVGEYTLADIRPVSMLNLQDIANWAIDILQLIHKRGILHNDIKPEHLVIFQNFLYLIDYGSAGPIGTNATFCTPKFASTSSYFGVLDEKSDFEALWFSLLSLCQQLPWDAASISAKDEFYLKLQNLPKKLAPTYPELANRFSLLC